MDLTADMNLKIPFEVSIRVTLTLEAEQPVTTQCSGRTGPPCPSYVIVRGCENLPVTVGSQILPPSARLTLHKIERQVFQPQQWVPLLDLPSGEGLVLLVALAASSRSYQFWEGCVHLYSPHDQPFPGVLLSTGTEDYL